MLTRTAGIIASSLAAFVLSGVAFAQQPRSASDSKPGPITGLVPDHATLSVENIETEAAWYERVLGFQVFRRMDSDPGFINQQMAIPGYRIDLIKFRGSKRPAATDPIYLQQGWIHVVFHIDNVAVVVRQLQLLKVEPKSVGKDDHGVPIRVLLRDPEDNEIEIRQQGK